MQDNRFDVGAAPQVPLRAERRPTRPAAGTAPVAGVEATSGGLVRSTLKAGGAAIALLTVFWLPAEYGIDPTRLGGVLGLTEMGQIKQQLAAEAAAGSAAPPAIVPAAAVAPAEVLGRLDRIEAQVAAIAAVIGAEVPAGSAPPPAAAAEPAPAAVAATDTATGAAVDAAVAEATADAGGWRDEVSYTLAPGEGLEIKLTMAEGETARFEWTANGSVLNYTTHGEGPGDQKASYDDGRGVADQAGELTAQFTGSHGWFWRNRTDAPVTLTLRTGGAYEVLKRL